MIYGKRYMRACLSFILFSVIKSLNKSLRQTGKKSHFDGKHTSTYFCIQTPSGGGRSGIFPVHGKDNHQQSQSPN